MPSYVACPFCDPNLMSVRIYVLMMCLPAGVLGPVLRAWYNFDFGELPLAVAH
jgi:hypothetical protein